MVEAHFFAYVLLPKSKFLIGIWSVAKQFLNRNSTKAHTEYDPVCVWLSMFSSVNRMATFFSPARCYFLFRFLLIRYKICVQWRRIWWRRHFGSERAHVGSLVSCRRIGKWLMDLWAHCDMGCAHVRNFPVVHVWRLKGTHTNTQTREHISYMTTFKRQHKD